MEFPIGLLEFMAASDAYHAETSGRPIAKAMRAVTVQAHFSHDGKGALHPVKAHVRWVQQGEYEITQARRIQQTHDAIIKLQKGKGKPPFITTMHMRIGPIGIEYERLEHIIRERKAHGQDLDACLKGIAECVVAGDLKIEPPGKDNKRDTKPQIWATSGRHQVTLSPFYDKKGLPTERVPVWVVSGYETGPGRLTKTSEAADLEVQIQNQPETK